MKSRVPKVLHPVCGTPMVRLVTEALAGAGVNRCVVVLPPGDSAIGQALGPGPTTVEQERPLGTGDALRVALEAWRGRADHVLVANGDLPLLRDETIGELMRRHLAQGSHLTFLTACEAPSAALGRIARDSDGVPTRIVEAADAGAQSDDLLEVNLGVYCLRLDWAREAVRALSPSPSGEVYLTDLVETAWRQGRPASTFALRDPEEGIGINTRVELARAEAAMRRRLCEQWMLEGVTMIDPATVYLDCGVTIGADSVIYPNTSLLGGTVIGSDCVIGPNSVVRNAAIGDHCRVEASVVEGATLEDEVEIGPYAHLRPEAYLEQGVHLGNFGEVKKSRLGRGVQMGHFSYVGDATIGAGVNIGAGTITCNYDGVAKHQTTVEEDVFLGSDTMLVAPVRVGARAATGAGAVVIRDVPPGTRVVGVPARPLAKNEQPSG